jgi:AcrR family transcriptional regulator
MEWQRARTEEQKEQRILEIVSAAARLYRKHCFEQINLTMIAKEASFTRSNLYKYFSSKEEIFLEFLKQDIIIWRKHLVKICQPLEGSSIETFAETWVSLLSEHKRLLDLLSLMPTYLEKNVSEETLAQFKRELISEIAIVSETLCQIFPKLDAEKCGQFIELSMASAIGLYQLTNLSPVQQKVLEYPEFQHFKMDFKDCQQKTVEALLEKLLN